MGWSSKSLVQKSAFQQKTPSSGTGPHGILSPKLSGQSFFSAKVFVFLLRICEFMVININIYVYTYIFIFFVSIFFCGEGSGIDSEKIHFNHRNHGLSSYHAAKMTKQIVANWLFSRGSQAAGRPRQAGDSQCAHGQWQKSPHQASLDIQPETRDSTLSRFPENFWGKIYLYRILRPVTSVNRFIKLLYISRFIHPVIYPHL